MNNKLKLLLILLCSLMYSCGDYKREIKTVSKVGMCTNNSDNIFDGIRAKCRVVFNDNTRHIVLAPVMEGDKYELTYNYRNEVAYYKRMN